MGARTLLSIPVGERMKESSLVRRYARALVLAVADEAEFRRVQADLAAFLKLLASDRGLRLGLETALVSAAEKKQALEIAAAGLGLGGKTLKFLQTVAAESRMAHLQAIVEGLEEAWFVAHGIERVEVASAVELSPPQRQRLRRNLEQALGRPVAMTFRLDPELIAGLRLARGSVRYDFSLAGSLQKLRQELAGDK